MKLSDYVAEFLDRYTDHAFVGNGGCVLHLLHSLNDQPGISPVPCENEQGAAIAAEAYSRVSGKLGVAVATSGPGAVNLFQGIACAYYDSIPSFFIGGEPPTSQLKFGRKARQIGFQEMDTVDMVNPITKYATLVSDPGKIRYEMEKLVYTAYEGRPGPVFLDLPDDIQRCEINPDELESFIPEERELPIDSNKVKETLDLIKQAKRPVVIVGGGVKIGKAVDETVKFLKESGLPYATTWSTIDLFIDNEPDLIGNFGVSSNRAGNFAVQNSDLIISLGSRLDTHMTGSNPKKFAINAKKVVVDIDTDELDKDNGLEVDIKILCNLKDFMNALIAEKVETQNLDQWKARIRKWRQKYPICLDEYKQEEKVNPYVFMNELSKESAEGGVVITDAGGTLTWTMQGYKIRKPQSLFSAFNHSPMGYAFPAAIGAKFAAPDSEVICIIGDGGMQMNIQEFETIVYNKLPIKVFLINNGEYGIIKQTQDVWMGSKYVASCPKSGLGFPDFQKVAKAYGMETAEIKNHREINKVLRKVLDYDGPILCDVKLKSNQQIAPKLEFGRPIEDSAPLLPREEFESNMKF